MWCSVILYCKFSIIVLNVTLGDSEIEACEDSHWETLLNCYRVVIVVI
jgi:hypothetical protein